jgi:23S rRNA (adenine2030-N6)-methyltransferase
MLSYRHAFHAGNHADVLKHFVLAQTLEYFSQKDKPYWYIDTHAGAGIYALDTGFAQQNAEFKDGIAQLWEDKHLPESLQHYVSLVKTFNPGNALRFYPGSPACARALMHATDRMRLFELHPTDFKLLQQTFEKDKKWVLIEQRDGFAGLKATLPPPPRRAVILIDPPYEQKQDYAKVIDALKDSVQRFATGTYILWYPLLQRPEIKLMQERLHKLNLPSWLHTTLTVQTPREDGFGMHGSGLFVINPPWKLQSTLAEALPVLVNKLGLDQGAGYTLEAVIP